MSDGPYKSLPLPRGWKKVAKCAETEAYSIDEIRDAVAPAIVNDWKRHQLDAVVQRLVDIFVEAQGTLFDPAQEIASLSTQVAGSGFRQALIDCALRQAQEGATGSEAVQHAATDALNIWAARHTRPIEEHYCREWDEGRANNVRQRIESGFGLTQYDQIARQLLKFDPPPAVQIPPKKSGLEEGPRL